MHHDDFLIHNYLSFLMHFLLNLSPDKLNHASSHLHVVTKQEESLYFFSHFSAPQNHQNPRLLTFKSESSYEKFFFKEHNFFTAK